MKIMTIQSEHPALRMFTHYLRKPDVEAAVWTQRNYNLSSGAIVTPTIGAVVSHVANGRVEVGKAIFDAFLRGKKEMRAPLKDTLAFLLVNGYETDSLILIRVAEMTKPEVRASIYAPYDRALKDGDYRTANLLGNLLNYGPYMRLGSESLE